MLQFFSRVESFETVSKCRKRKQSRCLVFKSSTKHEIRHFHVKVVQRRQRNVQKSMMHVQSCCFVNLNLLIFLTFSLTSPSSLLKLPNLSFVTLYSSYLAPGGWRPGPSKDTVYLLRDGWQFLPSVYFAPFSCEMGSLNGAYLTRIR